MILEESLKSLRVGVKAGGSIITHRPLFSRDTKSVYIVSSNTILEYSTATCFCTGIIRTPNAEVIANISIAESEDPSAPQTLFVLTIGGNLYEIDCTSPDHEIRLHANLNQNLPNNWKPITSWLNLVCVKDGVFLVLGIPEHSEDAILYIVTKSETKNSKTHLFQFNLEKICWRVIHSTHSIAVGAGGDLVAAIQTDSVFMLNTEDKASRWHKSGTRNFTCVACHPEDWVVATGDDSGRILLWRNFLEDKSPAKTVFHWHTLPVNDLCFTMGGGNMYSGSGECTLVKWDANNPDGRSMLPRTGLPIRQISISQGNTFVAISHADNCIQLIGRDNKIAGCIQNITQCYIPENETDKNTSSSSLGGSTVYQCGLHLDPRCDSLVLNGKPGHLQCYSYEEGRHLYTLDITQQNFVTAERQKAIPNADVSHISFSNQGKWLATTESLLDSQSGQCLELRLKFWKFEATKQIFAQNTTIHWPHENGMVCLKIQPVDDEDLSVLAATSGGDNKFKTWGIVSDNSLLGKDEWWSCENTGSYRELPAGPLAFSRDGSVLVASFGHTLTLWTCDTHQMKGTLCHTKLTEDIRLVEFGCHTSSHIVLCSTENNLIAWDVITMTLMWSVPLKVVSISVDPLSNLAAAFSLKNHVYFFRPETPEILAQHNNVSRSRIISSIFVPNSSSVEFSALKSTLMFINSSQELCSLLPKEDHENDKMKEIVRIKSNKPESILEQFAQIIPEKSVAEKRNVQKNAPVQVNIAGQPGRQVIREIMDASPHTMPSMTFFCGQLLSALSTPRSSSDKLEDQVKHIKPSAKKIPLAKTENEHKANPKRGKVTLDLDEIMNEDISWIRSVFSSSDPILR